MLSIIYPYRNRDIRRVKNSLESLQQQANNDFAIYLVNYGSNETYTEQIEDLLTDYDFVNYSYLYTELQPWNKSKAINSVLKQLETGYFFVADIDMIFHPNFTETAMELLKNNEAWYFQVGFLSEEESRISKKFDDYNIKFESSEGATGLTMCSVEKAKAINGFDEFYHFWGSEDTDFHVRLRNAGNPVNFYDKKILMLHQWHEIYRKKEIGELSRELQVSGIVQYNQYYLKKAVQEKRTMVNSSALGKTPSKEKYKALIEHSQTKSKQLSNKCIEIDYFLLQELPHLKPGFHSFEISEVSLGKSLKGIIKPFFKKHRKRYYSLKSVNDKLLFQIICLYRNEDYNYCISQDLKSIKFAINKL